MNTSKILPRGFTIWADKGIYIIDKSAAKCKLGDVSIETVKTPLGYQMSILNDTNFPMTNTFLNINKKEQIFDITKVKEKFRKMGLGEITLLADIMTLFKNKAASISLNTCSDGLDYHFKHKFKPSITDEYGAKLVLSLIKRQNNVHTKHLSEEAEFIKYNLQNHSHDKNTSSNLYKRTAELLENFLTVNKEHGIRTQHDNEFNLNMILDKKTIVTNKNYFSNLADKHDMDLTI